MLCGDIIQFSLWVVADGAGHKSAFNCCTRCTVVRGRPRFIVKATQSNNRRPIHYCKTNCRKREYSLTRHVRSGLHPALPSFCFVRQLRKSAILMTFTSVAIHNATVALGEAFFRSVRSCFVSYCFHRRSGE